MFLERRGCTATALGLFLFLPLAAGVGCKDAEVVGLDRRSAPPHETWWDLESPEGRLSPDAKLDTHNALLADLDAPRHPADGGGRAWLETEEPIRLTAGSRARFQLIYEAGPLGVAEGGVVFLQISPFWGWDAPQTLDPGYPGYTSVSSSAEGLSLAPETLGQYLLAIHIEGRALRQGEQLHIVYGAGPAKARVDQFAGADARLWIAVDGDGDGVRGLLKDSPAVRIDAGEPVSLRLVLPTTLQPGEAGRAVLAFFDSKGNAGMPVSGEVRIEDPPAGLRIPSRIRFEPTDRGQRELRVEATGEGVYRLRVRGTGALARFEAESNPLIVRAGIPRLLWGDLHGHSGLSDGTGTPEDYFRYARDVAGLDVSVITDHDHWGMRFLDGDPRWWAEVRRAVGDFHAPGRFVTILGYEWTSWLHGHRHVLYFDEDGEVHSSIDPRTTTPAQLWQALRDRSALTFAHHSAGGPVATNWAYPPDPILEPVTEIVSVHGSSEALDSPGRIYNPVPGNFVRDTLAQGVRFGFIGSGDSHDGHPGLSQLASPRGTGGLAAIFSEERTRASVLAALRARAVYASNGPRIWLYMTLDDAPMGAILPADFVQRGVQRLELEVVAEAELERIDLIRSGDVMLLAEPIGEREWGGEFAIDRLLPGEYVYLRVLQVDGGVAWSSPIYAGDSGEAGARGED